MISVSPPTLRGLTTLRAYRSSVVAFSLVLSFASFGFTTSLPIVLTHLLLLSCLLLELAVPDTGSAQPTPVVLKAWALWGAVLSLSMLRSGSPYQSQQDLQLWISAFLFFWFSAQMTPSVQQRLRSFLFILGISLAGWIGLQRILGFNSFLFADAVAHPIALQGLLMSFSFLALDGLRQKGKSAILESIYLAFALWYAFSHPHPAIGLAWGVGFYVWLNHLPQSKLRKAMAITAALLTLVCAGWLMWNFSFSRTWAAVLTLMTKTQAYLGSGPGTLPIAFPQMTLSPNARLPINSWIHWLLELGAIGISALVFLFFQLFRNQTDETQRSALVALIVFSTLLSPFATPGYLFVFLLLAGWNTKSLAEPRSARTLPSTTRLWLGLGALSLCLTTLRPWLTENSLRLAVLESERGENSDRLFLKSQQRSPLASTPWSLLATRPTPESAGTRGASELSLAYSLAALSREPVQPHYWAAALALCDRLELPTLSATLRERMLIRYPYLLHDKRLQ